MNASCHAWGSLMGFSDEYPGCKPPRQLLFGSHPPVASRRRRCTAPSQHFVLLPSAVPASQWRVSELV